MTTIEDALDFLSDTGPEYSHGLSNHGPMLAEALISLAQADLVMPWLNRYKRGLGPLPPCHEPIHQHDYRSALGDISRFRDWQTFFRTQLKEEDWKQVLNTWVDRLSPGYIAAAMHGIIRTGHAVRILTNIDSDNATNELANGLSYWAARYQRLPEASSGSHDVCRSIYDALHNITLLPEAQRKGLGLITQEIEAAGSMASFPAIIDLLDQDEQPGMMLSRLTEGFAHVFVCNAEPTGRVVALVHALTGPYALRHMLPYLEVQVTKKALRYAWQAAAALYVRYGLALPPTHFEDAPIYSEPELVERAIATHDEHAVKFVEACIAEHKLNPNPVYLTAATICCRLLS